MNKNINPDSRKTDVIIAFIVLVLLVIASIMLIIRNVNQSRGIAMGKAYENSDTTESTEGKSTGNKERYTENPIEKNNTKGDSGNTKQNLTGAIPDNKSVKRNSYYKEKGDKYIAGKPLEYTGDEYQLPELYSFWDEYKLEAVDEIIRLPRFRPISESLKDSNDYYYYGEKVDNKPDGVGLAVYSHNKFYFGKWKNGKRDGDGMWLQIFPDEPGEVNGVKGVTVHSYSGNWKDDYPEGSGQEHFEYDKVSLDAGDNMVFYNVIGEFARGLYNGKMLFMMDTYGKVEDWYGTCSNGIFEFIGENISPQGKRIILETEALEEDYYLYPADNNNWGISGLK